MIDPGLVSIACAVRANAYAPYSKYKVGAAVLTADGRVFGGCNVENASYGLCNCAERTAVFSAIAAGAKEVIGVAVVTEDGGTPCGACRQVLAEFAPRDGSPLVVLLADATGSVVRETTLGELFPDAFRL
jgi:cytidine deaminase